MTGVILWDLDGTLVDSEDYHWRAWQQTMGAEGLTISHEQFVATFGRRNAEILPHWLGPSAAVERIRQVGDDKEDRYRVLVRREGLKPLPGAAEWVSRLHAEGWRQAIASSAPRANVEAVVDALGLRRFFEVSVAAEDVTKGKPDPEVFLTAAARLGAPVGASIVVEDVAAGVEAARRAGMRSIGVSRNGAALGADIVVASLADLPTDAFRSLLAMR